MAKVIVKLLHYVVGIHSWNWNGGNFFKIYGLIKKDMFSKLYAGIIVQLQINHLYYFSRA